MKADWTTRPWRGGSLFLAALLLAGALGAADLAEKAGAAPGVKPVKELTRAADFVFRGSVRETGTANLSIVEPNAKTAVVRVEEVLKASPSLDDFTGREITVFLGESLRAGDQRVFFTVVRLLGESLGVQEVGRPADAAIDLRAQVHGAGAELLREDLAARLSAADLVVTGRVLETRPAATPPAGPLTEHDPEWREAVLEVSAVLKGKAGAETVVFWYPSSIDVMWAQVPKPKPGLEGTWLLHRHQPDGGAAVHAVVDRQDLLSAGEAGLARELAKP